MKCLLAVSALALGAFPGNSDPIDEVRDSPYQKDMPQPCLLRDNRISAEEMTRNRIRGTLQRDEKADYRFDVPTNKQDRDLYRRQHADIQRAREVCREQRAF